MQNTTIQNRHMRERHAYDYGDLRVMSGFVTHCQAMHAWGPPKYKQEVL